MKKTVRVLLKKDIPGTGRAGDVLVVAQAYAYNALLPKGAAVVATDAIYAQHQQAKQEERRRAEKQLERMAQHAQQLSGAVVTIRAKANEKGVLYGKLGAQHMVRALQKAGFPFVTEEMFACVEPITTVGEHRITVRIGATIVQLWGLVVADE